MPSGWTNVCEDESGKTNPEVIHAEANAVAKLARSNESGEGSVSFITHAPCLSCAKMLYSAGVCAVIYSQSYRNTEGVNFLETCGIPVSQYFINEDENGK
jgi:dCMP deaminase